MNNNQPTTMQVNSKLLEEYYKNSKISASLIKMYDQCPKKYEYRYIQKLPELSHDYFDTGKRVEEHLYRMLGADMHGYDDIPNEDEIKMAEALYNFQPFYNLIVGQKLTFQKEHFTDTMKGLTDIETPDCVIDIKTSASTWTEEMVRDMRWQALVYMKLTGKRFYFCIVNKKNKTCQLIQVKITDFSELELKIDELNLAIELGIFEPNPSWKCKWCDFSKTCREENKLAFAR